MPRFRHVRAVSTCQCVVAVALVREEDTDHVYFSTKFEEEGKALVLICFVCLSADIM